MEHLHRSAVEDLFGKWTPPPNYHQHPVVQQFEGEGKRVVPYYIFVDGVSYGKKNSVIVFTATNMLTNTRHLIGVLRKRVICGNKGCCSCSGWCTLHVVWLFIAYCVEQFGKGRFSEQRFPNHLDEGLVNGWGAADANRRAKAGEAMQYAGALLQVRADWAEISHSFGLSGWSDATDPCFLCQLPLRQLFDNLGDDGWAVPLKTRDTYDLSCRRCEVLCAFGVGVHGPTMKNMMFLDLRPQGQHGKIMAVDYCPLGLRANDRFEPSPTLLDYNSLLEEG
eukprot:269291-Amphidinium_carterae.1